MKTKKKSYWPTLNPGPIHHFNAVAAVVAPVVAVADVAAALVVTAAPVVAAVFVAVAAHDVAPAVAAKICE